MSDIVTGVFTRSDNLLRMIRAAILLLLSLAASAQGAPEVDTVYRTIRIDGANYFVVEKQTPEQVIKTSPECKEYVNTFGASYTYLQQIADLDLAVEWKKVDVPVLVTWGTSDPTTTAEENRYLADMINSFHPGHATYMEFSGMGHGLDLSPSPRAWLEAMQKHQHGPFDQEFLEGVSGWVEKTIAGPRPQ